MKAKYIIPNAVIEAPSFLRYIFWQCFLMVGEVWFEQKNECPQAHESRRDFTCQSAIQARPPHSSHTTHLIPDIWLQPDMYLYFWRSQAVFFLYDELAKAKCYNKWSCDMHIQFSPPRIQSPPHPKSSRANYRHKTNTKLRSRFARKQITCPSISRTQNCCILGLI